MYIDQTVAQRIEAQHAHDEAATVAILQRDFSVPSASALPFLGGYAVRAGITYPTNRAIGIGFHQTATAPDLERLEAFYSAAGLPPEIELCPFVDSSLITSVAQRCYTIHRFYNVYARPLSPHESYRPQSPDIHIREVQEDARLLWAQTVAGTKRPNDPIVTLAQATFHRPGVRCFLAIIHDEVAGGAALSILNGIGSLAFMGTVPAFRRRGVQNALIAERLAVAAAQGCDLAVCSTNPGNQSQRNVQRHGFSLAYTKVFVRKSLM